MNLFIIYIVTRKRNIEGYFQIIGRYLDLLTHIKTEMGGLAAMMLLLEAKQPLNHHTI